MVEKVENLLISTDEFDESRAILDEEYPTPSDETPQQSDLIDLCQERHETAHSGQIITTVKQEKFLEKWNVFFNRHRISDSTSMVCIPLLQNIASIAVEKN